MEDRRTEIQRLLETGQVAAAVAWLENEVRVTPDDPLLNAQIANVLLRLGRLNEARSYALRAIELAPELAVGHVQLAYVLLHMGRFAEAETAASHAQRLQPDSVEISLALLAALEGQGKLTEAESWAQRIVDREPNSPRAHKDLARLLMRQNRLVEAQHELWTAFRLHREYVTGWSLLVVLLRRWHLWWLLFLGAIMAVAMPSWYTAPLLAVGVIVIAGGAINAFLLHQSGRGVALLLVAGMAVALFVYGLLGTGRTSTSMGTGFWAVSVTPRPTLTGAMTELINQQCRAEGRPACLVVIGTKWQDSGAMETERLGSLGPDRTFPLLLVDTVLVNQSDLELMVDCFIENPAGQLYERVWDTSVGQDVLATARLAPGAVWRDTIRFALPKNEEAFGLRCQVYQRASSRNNSGIGSAVGYKHYDKSEDLFTPLP